MTIYLVDGVKVSRMQAVRLVMLSKALEYQQAARLLDTTPLNVPMRTASKETLWKDALPERLERSYRR